MDASLPTQLLAPDSSGNLSGLGGDLQGKQLDSGSHKGFGRLLEQAHAAISDTGGVPLSESLEGEQLVRQLQLLPQGGKLLPLLQQALDGAVSRGADPQQALERIAAKLEQLRSNTDMDPAGAIATALHQLLDEIAPLQTPAASTALARLATEEKAVSAARGLVRLGHQPAGARDVVEKLQINEIHRDSSGSGLDKALLQGQQPLQDAHQRYTDLASVLAAARRPGGDGKPAMADSVLRSESVMSLPGSPAAQTPASAQTSAQPTLNLATPFNQGGWDQALGERIQWMVSQKMQGAQIKLNPAHLGPMEVRVQMHNDQASIQFTSAHAVVREALETALPRLREMFESSAVELVDVDISGQSFAEQRGSGAEASVVSRNYGESRDGEAEMLLESPVAALLDSSRIDLFA